MSEINKEHLTYKPGVRVHTPLKSKTSIMKTFVNKIDVGVIINIIIATFIVGFIIYHINMYSELKFIKSQISNHIPTQIKGIKEEIKEIKEDIKGLDKKFDDMNHRLDDIFRILIENKKK